MKQELRHTENFIKGLTALTGLPYRKVQQYLKVNNPFNILEHPHIMEPNEKQLEKIGLLNEFIASYNILRIYESNDKIVINSSTIAGQYFSALLTGMKDKERFLFHFWTMAITSLKQRPCQKGVSDKQRYIPEKY